ncbi:hypothetical protein [Parerythrobacter lacustris]|uniref:Uncharacterized protein n=1 Tax=Parerythrobacter lacustris TaxID=2969984 RepID=A0ABT1XTL1_9SPHN|nr:hypothetical protein [Parerythrobacter lacustris]MCR2835009.1 hypothetical protein [Parerythrobacter lacustris]
MVDGPVSPAANETATAFAGDTLRDALDLLSHKIDAGNFERMRWARDEAPKLARLVELVKGAVADRDDVEINEEGGEGNTKRFVIKVHGQRIAQLAVALDKGRAIAAIGPVERSAYSVAQGQPIHAMFEEVDDVWMARTIAKLSERIGG